MLFHEKLKQCRNENKLSQETVAENLNVTRQAVSKWERGINEPDIETIVRLCDMYNVPIDQLLREDMSIVKNLAKKERSYKKLIIAVASLSGSLLLVLLAISFQIIKG
ncbi:MAG: helix-turn-helix domain-containing protein [Christensenellaceae bacterium]|jgi:transcriptional regulator with XRE-family HTH domain|nr:helix-turn-helix domain-containing protein [Christensenellaceae bacterium]